MWWGVMWWGVLFVAAAILLSLAIAWIWILSGLRRTGWRGVAGWIALNLSLVATLWCLLTGWALAVLLSFVLPVPIILFALGYVSAHGGFPLQFVPGGFAAMVLAIGLALCWPRTRRIPLFIGAVAAFVVVLWQGELESRTQMCATAEVRGIERFSRNSLLWSLRNTPHEFQGDVHAVGSTWDGGRLAWSYGEMDWYVVHEDTYAEVHAPPFRCD